MLGQDIKVMVSRIGKDVTLTVCIPVYMDKFKNIGEYNQILKKYEKILWDNAMKLQGVENYNLSVEINKMANGDYLMYSLIKGSCIECGEEGVVGRGNGSQGIISAFRPHTVEAPAGKNERYHTGRVLSFLAERAVNRIYNECGVKASIYCLTKNKNKLLEPFLFYVSVESDENNDKIKQIICEEFQEESYLPRILASRKLY